MAAAAAAASGSYAYCFTFTLHMIRRGDPAEAGRTPVHLMRLVPAMF